MGIVKKRKGCTIAIMLSFLCGVGILVFGLFFGFSKDTSLIAATFNLKAGTSIGDIFKNFSSLRFNDMNITFLLVWVGPFVSSFIALIFKKFRFPNIINVITFCYSLSFPFFFQFTVLSVATPLTSMQVVEQIFKTLPALYWIIICTQGLGLVTSFVNAEFTR